MPESTQPSGQPNTGKSQKEKSAINVAAAVKLVKKASPRGFTLVRNVRGNFNRSRPGDLFYIKDAYIKGNLQRGFISEIDPALHLNGAEFAAIEKGEVPTEA